jgi:hypothetical protein
MAQMSKQVILRRAEYWTRTLAQHEAAHIVTGSSRGGIPRYFLACGGSVTGGRTTGYQNVRQLQAHVCVGCVNEVTK